VTTIRSAAEAAARAAIAARVATILERSKAATAEGSMIDATRVLRDPAATAEICAFWVRGHRDRDGVPMVDVVVGPGPAGALLAFETARQLGVRVALDARDVGRRQRVVLVAASGPEAELVELLEALEAAEATIIGCHVIVGTAGGRAVLRSTESGSRYPFQALWQPPRSAAARRRG
jgi:hypothetical protein